MKLDINKPIRDHIRYLDNEILDLKKQLYETDKKWRDAKDIIRELEEENKKLKEELEK